MATSGPSAPGPEPERDQGDARYLRRARLLVRRYLLVHGGWLAAADARRRASGFPTDRFLADYLDGRWPTPEVMGTLGSMAAALEQELATRPAASSAPAGPWRRYLELLERLALAPDEADLVLVLAAAALDGAFAALAGLLGEDAGGPGAGAGGQGLSEAVLGRILDPLSVALPRHQALFGPTARLGRLGLVAASSSPGRGLVLSPSVLAWLRAGADALPATPPWAQRTLPLSQCAALAQRVPVLGAAAAQSIESPRLIVLARPGHGARWVAAALAARRGAGLSELSAAALANLDLGALGGELLVRSEVLLVTGWSGGDARGLARLATPVVIEAAPELPAQDLDHLIETLSAPVLSIPPGDVAARRACWQGALAAAGLSVEASTWVDRLTPHRLGVEQMDSALRVGLARNPRHPLDAVLAVCAELAPCQLDALLPRLPLPVAPRALSPELAQRLDRLQRDVLGAGGLAVLCLEPSNADLPTAAALLARDLDVPAFLLGPERLRPPANAALVLEQVFRAARDDGAALLIADSRELFGKRPELGGLFSELLANHRGLVLVSATDPLAASLREATPAATFSFGS